MPAVPSARAAAARLSARAFVSACAWLRLLADLAVRVDLYKVELYMFMVESGLRFLSPTLVPPVDLTRFLSDRFQVDLKSQEYHLAL